MPTLPEAVDSIAKAYGYAHRGHKTPNTIDTLFAIASGPKALTALAVVSLIEQCQEPPAAPGVRPADHDRGGGAG